MPEAIVSVSSVTEISFYEEGRLGNIIVNTRS